MTREQVSKLIRWPWIIWAAGIVNITAMLPRLWHLLQTHETKGLSVGMFFIYGGIQIAFALEGYFKRNLVLSVCLTLSAMVTAATISLFYYFQ